MNASELLVKCLENENVEYIFGVPGEENILFLEALRTSSIKYINAADERGAAFMAAAYGRFTGNPGVVATTIGPGALNIPNGLAYASLTGIPLIALTWQNGVRENIKDNNYQYVDVVSVLHPLTKWQKTLHSSDQIPVTVRQAFKCSMEPKAGPVHIEIPVDISSEIVESNIEPLTIGNQNKYVPIDRDIQSLKRLIEKAQCPLIIAGVRSTNSAVTKSIREFAKKAGVFVVTTPMAQGVMNSDHEYSLFSFVSQQRTLLHKAIDEVDLIMTVGLETLEYSPRSWNPLEDKTIVHIDSGPSSVTSNYNPKIEVIGDIAYTLNILAKDLTKKEYAYKSFTEVRELLSSIKQQKNDFPIHPIHLVKSLRASTENSIIIHDNGMHKLWMTQYFHPDKPNQVIIDNALATMASGIPQAITAKLLYPDKEVIVNIGDGGFLMSMGEVATIANLGLDIKIIVWNDNGYGMIRWHQEKNKLPSYGVSLTNPDFVTLAESFGGTGFRITDAEHFDDSLQNALTNKGFTIIECPVDYSDNMRYFSKNHLVEHQSYATQ